MARIPDPPEHLERLKNNLTTFIKKVLAPKSISENEDLNDYTEVGMYYCPTGSVATTLTNCPVSNAFSLFVERFSEYENATKQTLTTFDGTNHSTYTRTFQIFNGWQRLQYGDWKWVADYQNGKIHLYTNGTMGMIQISGSFTITCSANADYTLATMGTDYASYSVVSHPYSYSARDRNQLILIKSNFISGNI